MDHPASGLVFAAIGHQDNWEKVHRFVNSMRLHGGTTALPLTAIRELFGYIPPRKLFDIEFTSPVSGSISGMYIDTFIPPDELDGKHLMSNLRKVKDACYCAVREGASIVSLGGFTSIILEQSGHEMEKIGNTFFTTGNTLTAAYIVKSIEAIVAQKKMALSDIQLMIIGSTGDIGSACVEYFSSSVKKLLLCARRKPLLEKQAGILRNKGVQPLVSTDARELLPNADIIISVASSLIKDVGCHDFKEGAIICDAGYPKNLAEIALQERNLTVFAGGMGKIKSGYTFYPDYKKELYDNEGENIIHGCLAEGILLTMENTARAFSTGRGNITREAMEEIYELSLKHGIDPYIKYINTQPAYEKEN
jgi:fatty aldehyde-generating acyl-ACP reductase